MLPRGERSVEVVIYVVSESEGEHETLTAGRVLSKRAWTRQRQCFGDERYVA
jgi:hypothetical protein